MPPPRMVVLRVGSPVTDDDVERLCAQVREAARDDAVAVVLCRVTGSAHLDVVDALARVALAARRESLALRLCDETPDGVAAVRHLTELCGLADVLLPAGDGFPGSPGSPGSQAAVVPPSPPSRRDPS